MTRRLDAIDQALVTTHNRIGDTSIAETGILAKKCLAIAPAIPCQGKGLKGRLAAGTQAARKRIEILQGKAGLTGDLHTLAIGLLNDSVCFLDSFSNWMTNGYGKLSQRIPPFASMANLFGPCSFKECEAKIWEGISDARNQYADAARANRLVMCGACSRPGRSRSKIPCKLIS